MKILAGLAVSTLVVGAALAQPSAAQSSGSIATHPAESPPESSAHAPAGKAEGPSAQRTNQAATANISADLTDQKSISERLFGVFFEDINHAADGGLYAELVRNRSFEFSNADNPEFDAFTGWERSGGEFAISDKDPLHANNPHHLRVTLADGAAVVRNTGYNQGMHFEAGQTYDFSVFARHDGNGPIDATLRLTDAAGDVEVAARSFTLTDGDWSTYEVSVTARETVTDGRLTLRLAGAAGSAVDLDMVSLFPHDTFRGRENGMRKDLAQLIADLDPSFLRFPGGCLVNTGSFEPFPERERVYDWKDTIGPVEQRPTNHNFWGYNQSYGIGYYEYFQFAEDLDAEPIPVVPVGVTGCGDSATITDPDQLRPWIQDTLDLIEFANGDPNTEWGSVRAEMGHPEPFGLEYIGLGNEEYDEQFLQNYPQFHDAIRAKYPDIEIIANSGTGSSGDVFERNWDMARQQGADLVDEHYYNSPSWFLSNSDRYDDYDRDGPHVFIGEYASQGNAFRNALAEAAYLTGVVRNGDVVELASYAPLLANTDYVDWSPDAIWFDNHRSFGSANYWVQRMFSHGTGDQVVASTLDADPVPVPDIAGRIGLGSWNTRVAYDNVRVTSADGTQLFADDFSSGAGAWTASGAGGESTGSWQVTDGEYRQTEIVTDARSVAGSADWSNYTVELDARKLGGDEGFLIMFGAQDSENYYWWNLGGWNNTSSALEVSRNGAKQTIAEHDTTIETGRTYHLKIQVSGRHVTGWIDGEKVLDVTDNTGKVKPLYQVVTRDSETGETVLKVVNARDVAVETSVDLSGERLRKAGTVTTMTADPSATNTFENPNAVRPTTEQVTGLGNEFEYQFEPHSVTFIRLSPSSEK